MTCPAWTSKIGTEEVCSSASTIESEGLWQIGPSPGLGHALLQVNTGSLYYDEGEFFLLPGIYSVKMLFDRDLSGTILSWIYNAVDIFFIDSIVYDGGLYEHNLIITIDGGSYPSGVRILNYDDGFDFETPSFSGDFDAYVSGVQISTHPMRTFTPILIHIKDWGF